MPIRHGVTYHETLAASHVLLTHRRELHLYITQENRSELHAIKRRCRQRHVDALHNCCFERRNIHKNLEPVQLCLIYPKALPPRR